MPFPKLLNRNLDAQDPKGAIQPLDLHLRLFKFDKNYEDIDENTGLIGIRLVRNTLDMNAFSATD